MLSTVRVRDFWSILGEEPGTFGGGRLVGGLREGEGKGDGGGAEVP